MTRSTHPRKEIETVLRYAEQQGWHLKVGGGHAWGKLYCPYNVLDCRCGEYCITCVWSMPRNPEAHARALQRIIDSCSSHIIQRH